MCGGFSHRYLCLHGSWRRNGAYSLSDGVCRLFATSGAGNKPCVFIPIAIISLVLHTKNKLVEWKKAVPAVLWGTAAVIISAWLANRIEQSLLSKAFGIFLILMGLKELFFKSEKHKFKGV